ncbi:MAG: hypothetical protein P8K10_02815 [Crocinitomicaceae bacterium]|nr:hypothetical protein [Crocinitomicaceae bacterium]
MKIHQILFLMFAGLPVIVSAQKTKEVKKTVEVEVIKENDDTKTVIRTTENGKVKEEIFKGKEADAKLKEVQKTYNTNNNKDHTLDVEVKEINGKKTVKITESLNGKVTISEYEGKKADKKLKELRIPVPPKPKKTKQ